MAGRKRSGRSRRGTGTVVPRGDRCMAQIDLGTRTDGMRDRRSKSFDRRDKAEAWLLDVRSRAQELTGGVAEQPLAEYPALVDRDRGTQGQARPAAPGGDDAARVSQQHRAAHHPGARQAQGG